MGKQKNKRLTAEEKCYMAAHNALNREQEKQVTIFYSASAVVWWQMGWRKQRILRRFASLLEAWHECGSWGYKKSMLQILEEETGIELTLSGYDKSYHDVAFLDADAWDGKVPSMEYMTRVRQKQKPWVALMIFAGMCVALHRDEKWGSERLIKFIREVDEIRKELGQDPEKYKKLLLEVTGKDYDEWMTSDMS